MQNCFREYPEVYGSELEGDEEDERGVTAPGDDASAPADKGKLSQEPSSTPRHGRAQTDLVPETYKPDADSDTERADQTAETARSQEPVSESETLVPKAAHDAGDANTKILGRK
jgi:intermembrane space import and assembly protein 40